MEDTPNHKRMWKHAERTARVKRRLHDAEIILTLRQAAELNDETA